MIKLRPDIYPRTIENIKAILLYYFQDVSHSDINSYAAKNYDSRRIKLNELEYIAQKVHSNIEFFNELFNVNYINSLETFIDTTYQALFEEESQWSGSKNRLIILKKVRQKLSDKE